MTNGEAAGVLSGTCEVPADALSKTDARAVRAALESILASQEFASAPRLQRFLTYVVETTLGGHADSIRGYAIAVDVFDRPADFDPQVDSLVRVEAGRLRQKLDAYNNGPGVNDAWLITLPKGGYVPRFARRDPMVKNARAEPAPPVAKPRAKLAMGVIASIAVIGLMLTIGLALVRDRAAPVSSEFEATVSSVAQPAPALGVLPFAALATEPLTAEATATVANGLTTLVTADLVRFRQFFVLAQRSAEALTRSGEDPIAAARAADLDYVVDGTVRREGDAFVVTASLIDTLDGQTVWTETFRESAVGNGVLALEDRISGAIVTALAQPYGILNRQLVRAAHRAALPDTLASYSCILQADHYYATYDQADFATALACLEAALEREPDYAHGWAYLAYLRLDELRYGYRSNTSQAAIEAALAAAKRAVELEPDNAMAQRAMAAVLFTKGDIDGFRRHADRALELNPNDSDALADLGGKIAYSGDWVRGLALRQQAIDQNPAHPPSYRIPFVFDAFRRGDDAAALAELERIDLPNFLMTRLLKAAVLGRSGPQEKASKAVAELLVLEPDAAGLARDYFGYWNLSPELIGQLVDGLGRAGLDVSS